MKPPPKVWLPPLPLSSEPKPPVTLLALPTPPPAPMLLPLPKPLTGLGAVCCAAWVVPDAGLRSGGYAAMAAPRERKAQAAVKTASLIFISITFRRSPTSINS